jgi:RNA polymerase sigma-70 factor, ECF subfamily
MWPLNRVIAAPPETEDSPRARAAGEAGPFVATFTELYRDYFDFVWLSLRRLGVPLAHVNDGAQEVFLVVHRRIDEFEGRSSVKTWLFGIAVRIASQQRRTARRHPELPLSDAIEATNAADPHDATVHGQELKMLYELLDQLEDDKRAVFVLAELEQMTAPEIAEALSIKLNTVYSRLRAARRDFDSALSRRRKQSRRNPR